MTALPDSVREEAAKAAYNVWRLDFENEPVEWDALPDGDLERPRWFDAIDVAHTILRSADQQEIARLTEVNADLLSKIGPASYGFKDGIYNICLGYHDEEGVWEWLEVVDRAENARLTARLVEMEGAVREWQARYKALDAHLDTSPASLADEDLARWNDEHTVLYTALDNAEQSLAALSLEAPRE